MISKMPVFINIANRGISLLGNFGLILLIILFLDLEMQGFYYSFYSLIFLKFFAELGLGFAIIQTISHIVSSNQKETILASHISFFIKWYAAASILLLFVLMPAIYIFKDQYILVNNYQNRIVNPWIFLSIATALSVFLNGLVSILEGYKKILEVSKLRLIQSLTNVVVVALCLAAGFELWSLTLGAVASMGMIGLSLYKYRSYYLFPNIINRVKVEWRTEIWPFQWRLAVSWISGFFIFYFMTPLVLRYSGPTAAGQLGMSLQILQAINSIAVLFVSTNASIFGGFLAQKKFALMEKEFLSSAVKATVFLFILCAGFWIFKLGIETFTDQEISMRLVANHDILWLALAGLANHIFFIMNYYFRSFKQETLWLLSLVNSLAIIILGFLFVPHYGVSAAVVIYSVCNMMFWIIIGIPFFAQRRKKLLENAKM